MIMMMMNRFCGMVDRRRLALFPAGTIVRDPHHLESPSRVWTCAEPEFKLSWMKLCSSDNHGATYIESLFTDTERYWKSIKILKVYLLTFLCKKLLIS